MQIVNRQAIMEAYEKHPEWKASLTAWIKITEGASWRNFPEVRMTFNSADRVGKHIIFNIAHNRARLAAIINYADQRVTVAEVVRHAEYDRKDWE